MYVYNISAPPHFIDMGVSMNSGGYRVPHKHRHFRWAFSRVSPSSYGTRKLMETSIFHAHPHGTK